MAEKILEVKDLAISFKTQYGILHAIRGVSFDLHRGETLAIVGESGSGKSVTSRAIIGLLAGNSIYENGEIIYQDRDLTKLPEELFHEIRGSRISMIFQDPMSSLNPIQPVGEQIAESLIFKSGMPKDLAQKRAIELMTQVGITNAEKRYFQFPFQFSGGMRQRIVISIALAIMLKFLYVMNPPQHSM
jgi:oligopeptide transport system ATP-binding protein